MKKKSFAQLISALSSPALAYVESEGRLIHSPEMDKATTEWAALPLGSKSDLINSPEFAAAIYALLKNREINPTGTFDNKGRWYAHNSHLINVRRPSAAYPYSEMTACRTLKYVRAVIDDNHKDILNARNPFTAACHLV